MPPGRGFYKGVVYQRGDTIGAGIPPREGMPGGR